MEGEFDLMVTHMIRGAVISDVAAVTIDWESVLGENLSL